MTVKFMSAVKKLGCFSLLLSLLFACQSDTDTTINPDFLGGKNFETSTIRFGITNTNNDIDKVATNPLGQFLSGVYEQPGFGKIRASFISQLALPVDSDDPANISSGADVRRSKVYPEGVQDRMTSTIDDVILYIPYQYKVVGLPVVGRSYAVNELDSIYGVQAEVADEPKTYGSYQVRVFALATYLSSLEPTNPEIASKFYSDVSLYNVNSDLSGLVTIAPSAKDTITKISRLSVNQESDAALKSTDTLFRLGTFAERKPYMAIPLNKAFFQLLLLDRFAEKDALTADIPNELLVQQTFESYIRGLYVKTVSEDPASMASLKLTDAFVEMYYTNVVTDASTVVVKNVERKAKRFNLSGQRVNVFENLTRETKETDKLYVQGTAGSEEEIKIDNLISGLEIDGQAVESLEDIKQLITVDNTSTDDTNDLKISWLINEASIRFYVDGDFKDNELPNVNRLFLYNKTQNIPVTDYVSSPQLVSVQGVLTKDTDLSETDKNVYYYKFILTDYISEFLKTKNTTVDNFGLKVFSPSDIQNGQPLPTINSSNWNPKGVILYGGSSDEKRRIVLKIDYSKLVSE